METIDNLNIETSIEYARRASTYDQEMIAQAGTISKQAIIDVTTPAFRSELVYIFGTNIKNIPWGDFFAPKGYNAQKGRLFLFATLSALGSDEKKEMIRQRIQSKLQQDEKKFTGAVMTPEQQRMLREEQRESKVFLNLLAKIKEYDRDIDDINSKRSQYKKG
ncbi:MAG: hypothetical protein Tsb0015_15260 [Simkaniaceae bacterium]